MADKAPKTTRKSRFAPGNSILFRQWYAAQKQKDRRLANPPPDPE